MTTRADAARTAGATTSSSTTPAASPAVAALAAELDEQGIVAVRDAFPPAWAERLDEDLAEEFSRALRAPRGVAARGWNRFYFELYAERVAAVWDLLAQPLLRDLSEYLFGPDWCVVELGCDVPLPGAQDQPWHRDFPMPTVTQEERRLTSIAVNVSAIDVVDGPFQAVPGTHFAPGETFEGGMFPPEEDAAYYDERKRTYFARAGGYSVRSGLMVHRGSAMGNDSRMRPVAIVGIVAPDDRAVVDRDQAPTSRKPPRLRMSQEAVDRLDPELRSHLSLEVVAPTTATLPPHRTEHTFEGLKMDQRKS